MESIDIITPALYAGPQIHFPYYVVVHLHFGRWLSSTFLPIRYPLTIMSFATIHIPSKCSRHSAPKPLLTFTCPRYLRHLLLAKIITSEI